MRSPDRLILMGVFGAPQGVSGLTRIKSLTRDPKAIGAYGPLTDRRRARVFVFDSLRLSGTICSSRGSPASQRARPPRR